MSALRFEVDSVLAIARAARNETAGRVGVAQIDQVDQGVRDLYASAGIPLTVETMRAVALGITAICTSIDKAAALGIITKPAQAWFWDRVSTTLCGLIVDEDVVAS